MGIPASIGVTNNKITAKLGSGYRKPSAITRIESDSYQKLVYSLPVEDLLYVGPATKQKLNALGIRTIGNLAQYPVEYLTTRLGKLGPILHSFANGLDTSPVKKAGQGTAVKSVGNSTTTPRDLVNDEDVHMMLFLLAESVASRMRDLDSRCLVVELSVRDTGLVSFTRQRKLEIPTCSSAEIAQVAFELFRASYRWDKPVRSLGVRGAELVDAAAGVQTSLLNNDTKRENGNGSMPPWTTCASGTAI